MKPAYLPRISSSLLVLMACGALLTGCGGGGGVSATDDGANASAFDEPIVGAASAYLFGVTHAGTDTATTAKLNLVDDVTGAVVTSVDIDPNIKPLAAQAFTPSGDGLSQTAGMQTAAYYVYKEKLYAVRLLHPAKTLTISKVRQVSSESHVCGVLNVIPKDASAQTNWLRVSTAGADNDCGTQADNVTKLVSSDTATNVAGMTSPFDSKTTSGDLKDLVLDLRRDAQGRLVQALAVNPANNTLSVIPTTGSQAADFKPTAVLNGVIGADQSVSFVGRVAGSKDKIYLRVGNVLRVLDWSTGAVPTLETTVTATLMSNQALFTYTDAAATYFADVKGPVNKPVAEDDATWTYDLIVWQIKPGKPATQLATLSAGNTIATLPSIAAGTQTGASLAFVLRKPGAETLVGPDIVVEPDVDTLVTIKKSDGTLRNVQLDDGKHSGFSIVAHKDEVVLLSQPLDTTGELAKLWRLDLSSSGAPTAIADSASMIESIANPVSTLANNVQQDYVLWSTAAAGATPAKVFSHALSSNTTLTFGNTTTLVNWKGSALNASVTTSAVGLLLGETKTPATEGLWLFNAGKAAGAN